MTTQNFVTLPREVVDQLYCRLSSGLFYSNYDEAWASIGKLRAALTEQVQPKPHYKLGECESCNGEGESRKWGYDDYTNGFCQDCNGTGKAPVLVETEVQPLEFNGLTKEETDASMSVRGLSEQVQTSQHSTEQQDGWLTGTNTPPPVLFNPYSGEPRDVRDVQSDPQGVLIKPPGKVEMLAAPKPIQPSQEECKTPRNGALFDSQWVNIVNAPEVLNAFDKEEAVSKAIELAEKYFKQNLTLLQSDARTIEAEIKKDPQ